MTNEMMSMEQLNNVAGGTIAELKELVEALQRILLPGVLGRLTATFPE